jgi:hypothetical protein
LGAVKAVTSIKQRRLMNWRRYQEAPLLTGERPGIPVVRLIHRDSVDGTVRHALRTRLYRTTQVLRWATSLFGCGHGAMAEQIETVVIGGGHTLKSIIHDRISI